LASQDRIPPVTAELLSWLESVFIDRLPTAPQTDMAQVNFAIGQQSVLRKLRHAHTQQHEQALSGTP
jgi:hypothetical protein